MILNFSFYFILSIVCYLIGSFPTGVVITKQKYGLDVREMGSGNIGATNVTRVFGWYAGIVTLLVDFAKGFVPLWLLNRYMPGDPWILTVAALSLVLGHCFSFYLKFQGGKGVATGLGTVVAVLPWCGLVAVIVYLIVILASRISALGSLSGILSSLIYLSISPPDLPTIVLVAGVSGVVVICHWSNIKRLLFEKKESK